MPERETPGASASACASPTFRASPRLHGLDLARLGTPIGVAEQQGEDGHQDRDLPRLAEMVVDPVLAQAADDDRRDGPDGDQQGEAPGIGLGATAADELHRALDHHQHLRPEVGDDSDQRPQVQGDVERLVEIRVVLEVADVAQPGDQDEVPRRRDGKELRQPLHHAQEDRFQRVHRRRRSLVHRLASR